MRALNDVRIFLIGPTLLGLIHLAGSIFVDDVRQLVRKPPATVYSNVSTALANTPSSGRMQFEDGSSVPYRFKVDRGFGDHLVVHLLFNDRKAGQVDLRFTGRRRRTHADRRQGRKRRKGYPRRAKGHGQGQAWLCARLAAQLRIRRVAERGCGADRARELHRLDGPTGGADDRRAEAAGQMAAVSGDPAQR